MLDRARRVAALAVLISAPLGGVAQAHEGRGPRSEILAELPADAPPGDCYARVRAPGQPVAPPPLAQGARWVQNPGPPGSPGPIWCLVPTGPVAAGPPVEGPARYGWIRVLCDRDATPERIGQVQERLHQRGYYRGEVSGRYDAATAEALGRFQAGAHIDHGGYLSLETLDALDSADAGYGYQAQSSYGYSSGYAYQSSSTGGGSSYAYLYQAPPQGYYRGGAYGGGQGRGGYYPPAPYASGNSPVLRNGWLVWNGKTEF